MHRAARQLMLLLTMFAWLTANVHSAVAHCICAGTCHEAHSEALEAGSAALCGDSEAGAGTFGSSFIRSSDTQDCAHHDLANAGSGEPQGRGCCDSPDSNICLDHTQELVTAPVSFGSRSLFLTQSLSQFVRLPLCLFRALICASSLNSAHARNSARIPAAEDTRTFGWSHLVHTALPVRGPSLLA